MNDLIPTVINTFSVVLAAFFGFFVVVGVEEWLRAQWHKRKAWQAAAKTAKTLYEAAESAQRKDNE
ncbi:hypothetical protein VVR12_01690 [Rothia sp. LK2588]|uniref:hypothetical protein n=1 Tax=Rothia sp. LK2588 TaxID=3114369 RepID=UPI0034CECD02